MLRDAIPPRKNRVGRNTSSSVFVVVCWCRWGGGVVGVLCVRGGFVYEMCKGSIGWRGIVGDGGDEQVEEVRDGGKLLCNCC